MKKYIHRADGMLRIIHTARSSNEGPAELRETAIMILDDCCGYRTMIRWGYDFFKGCIRPRGIGFWEITEDEIKTWLGLKRETARGKVGA